MFCILEHTNTGNGRVHYNADPLCNSKHIAEVAMTAAFLI